MCISEPEINIIMISILMIIKDSIVELKEMLKERKQKKLSSQAQLLLLDSSRFLQTLKSLVNIPSLLPPLPAPINGNSSKDLSVKKPPKEMSLKDQLSKQDLKSPSMLLPWINGEMSLS